MIGIVMFFSGQIPLKVCLLLDFLVWNYTLTLCLRPDNLLNWWTSNVDFQCQPIQWALLLQRELSTLHQLLFACFMKPMYEVMLPKNITQIKLITKHKHKHWVQDFYFRLITNTLFNVLSLKAKLIPSTNKVVQGLTYNFLNLPEFLICSLMIQNLLQIKMSLSVHHKIFI